MSSSLMAKVLEKQSSVGLITKGPTGVIQGQIGKAAGLSATTTSKLSTWFSNNWLRFKSFLKTIPSYFQRPYTMGKLLLYAAIFGILVCIFVFGYLGLSYKMFERFDNQNVVNTANAAEASKRVDQLMVNSTENHETNDDYKLINLQPVCFKQAAYLGNDVFDSNLGIIEQLRLGSRFFFLQIDFVESDNVDNMKPYEPLLIWRQYGKNLSSTNSASLEDTFKSILTNYNNDSIPFNNYPVVIMLHFIRLPPKNKNDGYINKVSEALSVFKNTSIKGYLKASKEEDLFNNKFSDFNKEIIIGTNINTLTKDMVNLNKKIHFRYYVNDRYTDIKEEDESSMVDETDISNDNSVNAYIYNADTLLRMNDKAQTKWITRNKNKFTIIKPKNDQYLTKEEVDRLLNEFKVNVVLHDYFSDGFDNSKGIFNLYKNSCYKIKTT